MYVLTILLLVLIGGTFGIAVASSRSSSRRRGGSSWWFALAAICLMEVGAAGFFGCFLSAAGGLDWLPSWFEWPVGYATGVATTAEGLHVVPHTDSGRIQIYDANWRFLTGWPVDAGARAFKVLPPANGRVEVITALGQWRYVFDMDGRLISKSTYEPQSYDSFPEEGKSVMVPTPPWLLVFSDPGISFAVTTSGMMMLVVVRIVAKLKLGS